MDAEEHDFPSEFLLAGALTFAPLAFGTTEGWSRAVLAGLLSALLFRRFRRFGLPAAGVSTAPPLLWGMGIILVFAFIQSLRPLSPTALPLARGVFTVSRPLTYNWAFDWALACALLAFLPSLFRTRSTAERLAWLLLLCGALVAVIGIAQQQAGNEFYYGLRKVSRFRAPFGPFPNKNHAGGYLAISALAGAGLSASLAGRFSTLRKENRLDEFFGRISILAALEFLVLFGLFRTNSRGATASCLGAAGIAASLYAASTPKMGRSLALGALLAFGVALGGVAQFSGISWVSYIPAAGENSVTFRRAMVADGLKIINMFPWTGIGLGSLEAAYPLWMDPVMKGFSLDHLHCDPIELAAEAGLPLAAAYYLAYLVTLGVVVGRALSLRTPDQFLPLAFAAAGAGFLAHQALEFPSHITSLHMTAITCLSAAWGLSRRSMGLEAPARPPGRPLRTAAAACLAAYWLVCLTPRLVAGYFDLLASRYPQPSKQYYQIVASHWEPTALRSLAIAQSYRQLAYENPPARTILLRTSLKYSAAALDLLPLDHDARWLQAQVLFDLGRKSDAKELLQEQ